MKSINEKLLEKVSELYECSVENIAMIEPRAYDITVILSTISELYTLEDKTKVTLEGRLSNFRVKDTGRFTSIYADLLDRSGMKQICQWASSSKAAQTKMMAIQSEFSNRVIQVTGSINSFVGDNGRVIFISNPKCKDVSKLGTGTIAPIPIYTLKGSIKEYELKRAIELSITNASSDKYSLTYNIEQRMELPNLQESLRIIHGLQGSNENIDKYTNMSSIYHHRIKLEKIHRTLARLKNDKTSGVSPILSYSKDRMRKLQSLMGFEFTKEQKSALKELFMTFSKGVFTTNLLVGDVGSGKTATSIAATLCALDEGYQVAVVAPSSVLAKQLHEEYASRLEKMGYTVEFLQGKITKKQRRELQERVLGNTCVVIGTTAVNNIEFDNLGLVVVDEEQKIGVEEKRKLLKGRKILPYCLYMSATPLPRSLASSIYGNFQSVTIKAKPQGRIPVKTKVIESEIERDKLFSFIVNEAKHGRSALIVAPSIESGEIASVKGIEEICANRFGATFFKSIHGQLKNNVIEERVQEFRNGKFPLIIATTMVEAGFSIPHLSTVICLSPDRFGLAQLHQLRGRAGRSKGIKGYCGLMDLKFTYKEKVRDRLEFFCSKDNGLELANHDLNLRGSGDLTGNAQSGGDVNFIEYEEEIKLLQELIG